MKCLVIVESPSKCKIIAGYLNNIPELVTKYGQFSVVASCGHIRDLKKKELSIDIANNFNPIYEVLSDSFKKKLVSDLKLKIHDYVSNKDMILLATDSDAEGEAISWHIREYFKLKSGQYKRIVFNEITKNALKHAVLNAGDINIHAVDAQETRRILDRIVGYKLSPLLWSQFNQSRLSAGRVQSAALKIIVDRNNEITDHVYQPYWKCNGMFKSINSNISNLPATHTQTWDSHEFALEQITKNKPEILATINWIAAFKSSQRKKSPPPPLITSTFQQECYKRFKINSKSSMMIAQKLYESGHITYMRTDSPCLSEDAHTAICAYINTHFGANMIYERKYENKNSSAQEAHEAIRPTYIDRVKLDLDGSDLNTTHQKVYELIWKYTVASQMAPALYTDVIYTLMPFTQNRLYSSKETELHVYNGKSSILMKEGFMVVLMPETKANPDALKAWSECLENGNIYVKIDSFELNSDVYRPSPYFNEASFVKTLEKEGIGRPSTYASVVDKLYDKQYIVKGIKTEKQIDLVNCNWNSSNPSQIVSETNKIAIITQDTDNMVNTSTGESIVQYISNVTPYMINTTFTKLMESDLDKIASSQTSKLKVLSDFYTIFEKSLNNAQSIQNSRTTGEIPEKPKSKLANPLKDFPELNCGVVTTKYGPALYHRTTKKFHSIMPLLEWRQVTIDAINVQDVRFILSLPLKITITNEETVKSCTVELGRYGFYLKIDGQNIGLHPDLWKDAYAGTLTYKQIVNNPAPKPVINKSNPSTPTKTFKKYKNNKK